jgi:DNA topoisomerase-1
VLGLRASGKVLKFSGWLEQYQHGKSDKPFGDDAPKAMAGEGEDDGAEGSSGNGAGSPRTATMRPDDDEEGLLPELDEGEELTLVDPPGVKTEQKFTQPPPRYNEGSLVRELEKRGIGRPSTYAEIISKVQARDYVERMPGGQMKASELGKIVVDGLVATDLDFMDPSFTAKMEQELDAVGAGKLDRVELLSRFYDRFRTTLDRAKKQKRWTPEPEPTEHVCDECGGVMLKRWSKNGWFLGCEAYPKCKFTRDLGQGGDAPAQPRETGIACDKCGKPMVVRSGRYGEFLSCSGYPACKNAKPVPLGVPCPKCGGDIIEIRTKKGGRPFFGCANYPSCDFKSWQKPIPEPCPNCGHPFLIVMGGKKEPRIACPKGKECGYSRPIEEQEPAGEREAAHEPSPPQGKGHEERRPALSP